MNRLIRNIAGVDVLFVRIGSIVGYFFSLDGKEYGNSAGINGKSIEIPKDITEDEVKFKLVELTEDMIKNAEETIAKYRK